MRGKVKKINSKQKHKIIEVEVARAEKVGVDGNSFHIKTHLGNILRVGDTVLGYDMVQMINNAADYDSLDKNTTSDVVLVKKIYPEISKPGRKRIFKLERMQIEKNDKGFEEFLDEVEQDPDMRVNMNLYRNPEVKEEVKCEDETFPGVKLEELIGALSLEDNS